MAEFMRKERELGDPAFRHYPVTPSDSVVLDPSPSSLIVYGGGVFVIEDIDGNVATHSPSGDFIIPMAGVTIVRATGTTVGGSLIAVY